MKSFITKILILTLLSITFVQGKEKTPKIDLYQHLLQKFEKSQVTEEGARYITFQSHTNDFKEFDKEISQSLGKFYPKKLKDALSSSGNMHNPKVIPLRKLFNKCLQQTNTIESLAEALKKKGYMITEVGNEKLVIDKSSKTPRFKVCAWLKCEKVKAVTTQ